jgi:hypothetical protein
MAPDPTRPTRRMRSAAVSLGLVGALAFTLSGCGTNSAQAVQRQCVDDFGQVVAEAQCLATPVAGSSPRPGTTSNSRPYRYYYGGTTSGGRVTGGSYDPPANYKPSGSGSSSSSGVKTGSTTGGVDTGGFGGKSGSSSSSSSSGGKSGGSSGGASSSSGGS